MWALISGWLQKIFAGDDVQERMEKRANIMELAERSYRMASRAVEQMEAYQRDRDQWQQDRIMLLARIEKLEQQNIEKDEKIALLEKKDEDCRHRLKALAKRLDIEIDEVE